MEATHSSSDDALDTRNILGPMFNFGEDILFLGTIKRMVHCKNIIAKNSILLGELRLHNYYNAVDCN